MESTTNDYLLEDSLLDSNLSSTHSDRNLFHSHETFKNETYWWNFHSFCIIVVVIMASTQGPFIRVWKVKVRKRAFLSAPVAGSIGQTLRVRLVCVRFRPCRLLAAAQALPGWLSVLVCQNMPSARLKIAVLRTAGGSAGSGAGVITVGVRQLHAGHRVLSAWTRWEQRSEMGQVCMGGRKRVRRNRGGDSKGT